MFATSALAFRSVAQECLGVGIFQPVRYRLPLERGRTSEMGKAERQLSFQFRILCLIELWLNAFTSVMGKRQSDIRHG